MAGFPLPPVPYSKSFAQIVSDFAAMAQATSGTPLDFTEGSVFLALAEATAGVSDWLQKLYLFSLIVGRLQTSQGPWVDSFTADYMPPVVGTNSPRLPASPASGPVTFSRNADQSQAVVPVGSLVATFDGAQVYQVLADTTNTAYSATVIPGGGFIIPAGTASINITVTALTPGSAGNALANTITLLKSSVVGVDTVNNSGALTSGLDPETDDSLKARFKQFIASLRAGTPGAIAYAVTSLRQGLQVTVHENINPDGTQAYGVVTVYVDDGSGSPSALTVENAAGAINGSGNVPTTAATETTSAVLTFGNGIPSWLATGMTAVDFTTPSAITNGQKIQAIDTTLNTVTLDGLVNATVNSGDVIGFSNNSSVLQAVRAAGVRVNVLGATTITANIDITIVIAPGYNNQLVVSAVSNAVSAYVNSLGLEATLPYTMIEHVAYNSSPGVTNVTNVFLNEAEVDLVPTMGHTIKIGTLTVQP